MTFPYKFHRYRVTPNKIKELCDAVISLGKTLERHIKHCPECKIQEDTDNFCHRGKTLMLEYQIAKAKSDLVTSP